MNKRLNKIRVAKYKRVSTDEQKLKKNSIIAQDELLDEYISNHKELVLVGDFSDEGVSGTKIKRTQLDDLLKMVEAKEVDLILITKLDRWFRNVKFYYKVQDILDRNGVAWRTILEDYDTTTATGKLNINIALTLAQHETDKTSDRIKVVFDYKVKHGHAITSSLSYGFKLEPRDTYKVVVHDKDREEFVYDFLEHFETTQSLHGSMVHMNTKYNVNFSDSIYRTILTDPMMYGSYRDNDNYCEPYITKERFLKIQDIIKNNIKCNTKKGRVYIFSGLLRCPLCGCKMAGDARRRKLASGEKKEYKLYICTRFKNLKKCDNRKHISETFIERMVLAQLMPQLEKLILEAEIQEAKPKPKVNKKAIQQEIDRLNNMYQKGRISDEKYDQEYEALSARLNESEQEPTKKDYSKIKEMLGTDFKSLYDTFTDKEKQMFYRSIIESIVVDGDDITINFL